MWLAGASARIIANALGTSKNSVVGKAHRLGLPNRPSPIVKEKTVKQPKAVAQAAPSLLLKEMKVTQQAPNLITTPRLAKNQCEWRDGNRPHFRRCEEPAINTMDDGRLCPEGAVWCRKHRPRVYHKIIRGEAVAS